MLNHRDSCTESQRYCLKLQQINDDEPVSETSGLSSLLDHISTAILLVAGDLHIRYLNPAAEALLESSNAQMQGTHIGRIISNDQGHWQELTEAAAQEISFTHREVSIFNSGGHGITVDYIVTPVDIDNNGQIALLIELQPIDRLLRISREESMLNSQQHSRMLIRGLAHEIKNPLGGLRGAAQLLESELENPSLREYTQIIIEEADRLGNLVDRLLGPRKIPNPQELNIHEVLERVIALIRVETGDAICFTRNYDVSIPNINGDKAQLIQAVLNIVGNARQALMNNTIEAPEIQVRTRVLRQFTIGTVRHRLVCRCDIIDNGPGIPDELKESLFYPMVSGRAEGTGLGLSIAQSILNQHKGLIECESYEGSTTFSLYIPLEIHYDA